MFARAAGIGRVAPRAIDASGAVLSAGGMSSSDPAVARLGSGGAGDLGRGPAQADDHVERTLDPLALDVAGPSHDEVPYLGIGHGQHFRRQEGGDRRPRPPHAPSARRRKSRCHPDG
jgi:hypothetical protein